MLQTLWLRLYSPHLGHLVIPGSSSFQTDERLLSLLAFDVFLFGTAIPNTSLAFIKNYSFSKYLDKTESRGSISLVSQEQGDALRFFPHLGHKPLQSLLHRNLPGISRIILVLINSASSNMPSSRRINSSLSVFSSLSVSFCSISKENPVLNSIPHLAQIARAFRVIFALRTIRPAKFLILPFAVIVPLMMSDESPSALQLYSKGSSVTAPPKRPSRSSISYSCLSLVSIPTHVYANEYQTTQYIPLYIVNSLLSTYFFYILLLILLFLQYYCFFLKFLYLSFYLLKKVYVCDSMLYE